MLSFAGTKTAAVVVTAREFGDGLCGLYVALPELHRKKDRAHENLLRASFDASCCKAFTQQSNALVLAAALPLASLDPESFVGVGAGLAALANLGKDDLVSKDGLKTQLALCGLSQARRIALDQELEAGRLRASLDQAGLPHRDLGQGALATTVTLSGSQLECVVRPLATCLSFIVYLTGLKPKGEESLSRLLSLNCTADVARCGIERDGNLALLYEVPSLHEGILDDLVSQFTNLLLGVALGQ